jgi:hypothetical protein
MARARVSAPRGALTAALRAPRRGHAAWARARPAPARRPARAAAAAFALSPEAVFGAATLAAMPFYALIIGAPRSSTARALVRAPALLLAASALYAALLAAWHLVPAAAAAARAALAGASPVDVAPFAAAFARREVAATAWVHLLLADLFQASWVWADGAARRVPVAHSAALCFMAAPLGLLSHLATRAAVEAARRRREV